MNNMTDFFTTNLEQSDPEIAKAIHDELVRQQDQIEMIASENMRPRRFEPSTKS